MPLRQRSARFLASLNEGGEVVRASAFLQLSKSTDSKIGVQVAEAPGAPEKALEIQELKYEAEEETGQRAGLTRG